MKVDLVVLDDFLLLVFGKQMYLVLVWREVNEFKRLRTVRGWQANAE